MSGNSGRGWGSYSYASKESQMKAFDRLPRSVREALRESPYNWASYPIWRKWNAGVYPSADVLVKLIKQWDRDRLAKTQRLRRKVRGSGKTRERKAA